MRDYVKQKNGYTKVPDYIINAMQGLAYWIGYKKRLYKYYSLSESAVVTEFCALLQAGLNENEYVLCERQYCNFFSKQRKDYKRCRMDVTVAEFDDSEDRSFAKNVIGAQSKQKLGVLKKYAKVVFEVKLLNSPDGLKKEDFSRLKSIKDENPDIITYSLLISEDKIPKKFVNEISGIALKDENIKFKSNDEYKIHVAKVRCALENKLKTVELKNTITRMLSSNSNLNKKIRDTIDIYMKNLFAKGAYVCLIEVV